MQQLLGTLFGWPNGITTGNLIASGITTALGVLHLRGHIRKHAHTCSCPGTLPAGGPGAQGADTSLADEPLPGGTSGPPSPRYNDV